jgi:hypothetical protein
MWMTYIIHMSSIVYLTLYIEVNKLFSKHNVYYCNNYTIATIYIIMFVVHYICMIIREAT